MSATTPNTPARPWRPLHEFYKGGGAPVVKCPNYWLCGDYATMGQASIRPGKVRVLCAYCAQEDARKAAQPEVAP